MPMMRNIKTLYQCLDEGGQEDVQPIDDAALVWHGDTITWVGKESDLPSTGIDGLDDGETHDAGGYIVTPGLIDCHTHLAFGGWREDEFAMRCQGASYLDIAKAGGGIMKTVRQTRAASSKSLFQSAKLYLWFMRAAGVTTVECKSGYGLTVEDEIKLLRVYKQLAETEPSRIVATLLGAHVVPQEFKNNREGYLDLLCNELIPQVAEDGLAQFNDVFVEEGAFTIDEGRRVLECGKQYGLMPKLHVDQLCDGGGAALAAEVGAVSADHLEFVSDAGIAAMAEAGTVAVTLPLASLVLRQPPLDARRLIEAGVPAAVATDFNPGSAPSHHLPWSMSLACMMNRMSPCEALKGVTVYAAKALGLNKQVGSLCPGMKADFIHVTTTSVEMWFYQMMSPSGARDVFIAGNKLPRNSKSGDADQSDA